MTFERRREKAPKFRPTTQRLFLPSIVLEVEVTAEYPQ